MKQLADLLISRGQNWAHDAPLLAGLAFLAAALVFWRVYQRRRSPDTARFWPWLRPLLEAGAVALLLLLVLWGVRLQLNKVERDFQQAHGRISEVNLQSVRSIWGDRRVQGELRVRHTYVAQQRQQIPSGRPDEPPRFLTQQVTREYPQNSLVQTRATATIHMNYRRKGSAYYPCFEDDCAFRYTVTNLADRPTTASFTFPLYSRGGLFNNFRVLVDGRDFSNRLSFQEQDVNWSLPMKQGQTAHLEIAYQSRGMETWSYQMAGYRETRDFELVIALPEVARERLDYPEGCLTPTAVSAGAQGRGSTVTWRLDRAITARGMGVELPAPPQPGNQVSRVLAYAWRGATLLLVGLTLSLLGGSARLLLVRLGLVGGAYCAQYMLLAALSDTVLGFYGALGLGVVVAACVSLLTLRWPTSLWRGPALPLVAFFLVAYPLLALPKEAAPAAMRAVEVAALAYLAVAYARGWDRSGGPAASPRPDASPE